MKLTEKFTATVKSLVRRVHPLRPQQAIENHSRFLGPPPKARGDDLLGRMREIISDPLNLLIERHPCAGTVDTAGCVRLHNGLVVPISGDFAYYEDFSAILVLNRGVHEPLEEYVFQEVLRTLGPEPTMLELGAYWSHYSMWLKSKRPSAFVTMVEPDRHNIEVGKRNFQINGFSGEFIQAEVGAQGFSVDQFLEGQDVQLSILHSDIQGFEVEMLHGARRSLERRAIERVFISTHSESLHAECLGLLAASGYVVELSSAPDKHSTSYDGFIFACSPNVPATFPNFTPAGRLDLSSMKPVDVLSYLQVVTSGK